MNSQPEPQVPEVIIQPKEPIEYVKPKLEIHLGYRILIAGGGSI